MQNRLWPRLALEACFLAGVAVVAGLLHLSTAAIVAVMFVAWLLTAAVEWAVSRAATTTEPVVAAELAPARARVGSGRFAPPNRFRTRTGCTSLRRHAAFRARARAGGRT